MCSSLIVLTLAVATASATSAGVPLIGFLPQTVQINIYVHHWSSVQPADWNSGASVAISYHFPDRIRGPMPTLSPVKRSRAGCMSGICQLVDDSVIAGLPLLSPKSRLYTFLLLEPILTTSAVFDERLLLFSALWCPLMYRINLAFYYFQWFVFMLKTD